VDEILKFLKKIKIATRNWLQIHGRTKKKGIDKGIEKEKK
jgi:hypothetical protein